MNANKDAPKASRVPDNVAGENWETVCRDSIRLICDRKEVAVSWVGAVPDIHRSLAKADDALLARHHLLGKDTTARVKEDLWKKSGFARPGDVGQWEISPSILWEVYIGQQMVQSRIKKRITHKKKETKGLSASSWQFENLIDLSCVPLFNLGLDSIIPWNYESVAESVMEKINDCYIVRRMLNEITIPSAKELYQFNSTTHISWYLLNPWSLFFIGLRDLLTRGEGEIDRPWKMKSLDTSDSSMERKHEAMSEQLLHRFMEVVLVLFSILCGKEDSYKDHYRSTPGRVDSKIRVGCKPCQILDDGYIYMARGGTTKKGGVQSDRNRYGKVPILRYEAKRLAKASGKSSVTAQIFAELLSAAVENMVYFTKTDPVSSKHKLEVEESLNTDDTGYRNRDSVTYHDATTEYDLSEPEQRLSAARDILVLLYAIRCGGVKDTSTKIFVARALMKQTIGTDATRWAKDERATNKAKKMSIETTFNLENRHVVTSVASPKTNLRRHTMSDLETSNKEQDGKMNLEEKNDSEDSDSESSSSEESDSENQDPTGNTNVLPEDAVAVEDVITFEKSGAVEDFNAVDQLDMMERMCTENWSTTWMVQRDVLAVMP
ncbi:hypothetical protein F52700_5373 [Fusarium sp. NRRL 52700]|nr:hypothetical protein F52700_5373 [Fusarium sp. NRRL 52700]